MIMTANESTLSRLDQALWARLTRLDAETQALYQAAPTSVKEEKHPNKHERHEHHPHHSHHSYHQHYSTRRKRDRYRDSEQRQDRDREMERGHDKRTEKRKSKHREHSYRYEHHKNEQTHRPPTASTPLWNSDTFPPSTESAGFGQEIPQFPSSTIYPDWQVPIARPAAAATFPPTSTPTSPLVDPSPFPPLQPTPLQPAQQAPPHSIWRLTSPLAPHTSTSSTPVFKPPLAPHEVPLDSIVRGADGYWWKTFQTNNPRRPIDWRRTWKAVVSVGTRQCVDPAGQKATVEFGNWK